MWMCVISEMCHLRFPWKMCRQTEFLTSPQFQQDQVCQVKFNKQYLGEDFDAFDWHQPISIVHSRQSFQWDRLSWLCSVWMGQTDNQCDVRSALSQWTNTIHLYEIICGLRHFVGEMRSHARHNKLCSRIIPLKSEELRGWSASYFFFSWFWYLSSLQHVGKASIASCHWRDSLAKRDPVEWPWKWLTWILHLKLLLIMSVESFTQM